MGFNYDIRVLGQFNYGPFLISLKITSAGQSNGMGIIAEGDPGSRRRTEAPAAVFPAVR
ncbi:hypothetical protein SAMN05216436_12020 [bacterium A37T11]|nr:hypothetical protein SAMN05216436_12020 [bacterium A37T11]